MAKTNRKTVRGWYFLAMIAAIVSMITMVEASQQKIAEVRINVTAEITNSTNMRLILTGEQNNYEWNVGEGTSSKDYVFLDVVELQCTEEGIENLTSVFISECKDRFEKVCVDEEGMSFKERWKGCSENLVARNKELDECKLNKQNITDEKAACDNDVFTYKTQAEGFESQYNTLSADNSKVENNKYVWFAGGVGAVFLFNYWKKRKERPTAGPEKDGFMRGPIDDFEKR